MKYFYFFFNFLNAEQDFPDKMSDKEIESKVKHLRRQKEIGDRWDFLESLNEIRIFLVIFLTQYSWTELYNPLIMKKATTSILIPWICGTFRNKFLKYYNFKTTFNKFKTFIRHFLMINHSQSTIKLRKKNLKANS